MRLTIDTTERSLLVEDGEGVRELPLYSREAFQLLSLQWVKVGWDRKYSYTFSWLGRPLIQLPEDVLRIQEVIYRVKPAVIVETGVAHGGSLIFYATLCKAMGHGRVIGVDIRIRDVNRRAIEAHELSPWITLIEGDSAGAETVKRVESLVRPGESVLVILDSCHTKEHVAAELHAYHGLVTPGSYLVATDGIMKDLHDVPHGESAWRTDNPTEAAREFAQLHPDFELGQPSWPFNESELTENVTYWPGAWLRKKTAPGVPSEE